MIEYDLASLASASVRRRGSIELPGIQESARFRRAYLAELRRMLKAIATAARPLARAYVADALGDDLQALSNQLVAQSEDMVRRILALEGQRHTERFHQIARRAIGVDLGAVVRNEDLGPTLETLMVRNASLIRNLADDAIARVQRAAADTVLRGQTQRQLASRLVQELGVLDRRAQLIARDQTASAVSQLNELRHTQAGITTYRWSTSRDERVRPRHQGLEGNKYKYGQPTGAEGGLPPGGPIMCRCTARGIVEFGEEQSTPRARRERPAARAEARAPQNTFQPRKFTPAKTKDEAADLAVEVGASKFKPEWSASAKLDAINEMIQASMEVDDRFELPEIQAQGAASWIVRKAREAGVRLRSSSKAGAWWWGRGNSMGWNPKALQDPETVRKNFAGHLSEDRIAPGHRRAIEALLDNGPGKEAARKVKEFGWLATRNVTTRYMAFHEHGHRFHDANTEEVNKAAGNFIDLRRKGWMHALSKYAMTNSKEFVAEAFALYMAEPDQHWRIKPELLAVFRAKDRSVSDAE